MSIKLIADCGSTATRWVVADSATSIIERFFTQGLNPLMPPKQGIEEFLRSEVAARIPGIRPDSIAYYGAGCLPHTSAPVAESLQRVFCCPHVEVESDLLGAARSLCGRKPGIAAILGTGSNSCSYDGSEIIAHTPALGYILGDEGSGASLGRQLINARFKGSLPQSLVEEFDHEYHLSMEQAIEEVYRGSHPNRWLAAFAPFFKAHRSDSFLQQILLDSFRTFFTLNIKPYRPDARTPIVLTGSVAVNFAEEVSEAARQCNIRSELSFVDDILPGLLRYHFNHTIINPS